MALFSVALKKVMKSLKLGVTYLVILTVLHKVTVIQFK